MPLLQPCDIDQELFKHEQLETLVSSLGISNPAFRTPRHNTRASFTALMKFVSERVHADWKTIVEKVVNLIVTKQNPLSPSSAKTQELDLQLHLQGVYNVPTLMTVPTAVKKKMLTTWPALWELDPMPPAIPFVFKVPRSALDVVIAHMTSVELIFEVHIISLPYFNIFSSFNMAFIKSQNSAHTATSQWIKDPKGWTGSSDLAIHVLLPIALLRINDNSEPTLALQLSSSIQTTYVLSTKLGPELTVFQTKFFDTDRVTPIVPRDFNSHFPLQIDQKQQISGTSNWLQKISQEDGSLQVTARVTLTDKNEKISLVECGEVTTRRTSPCTLTVNCGEKLAKHIVLAFPFQFLSIRLRVARKSGWIEAIAILSSSADQPFHMTRTPVLRDQTVPTTFSWNLPRL